MPVSLLIRDVPVARAFRRRGLAEALGVTYGGAANNLTELVAQGVAEEVPGSYPKLIRFPGVVKALRVG